MFSNDALVLTVKTNLAAMTSGIAIDPMQLITFFEMVNSAVQVALDKHEPLRIRSVSDVFQAVFDCREKNLAALINVVRDLPYMNQERTQTTALVRRFVQGTVEPYEWDDFVSIPLRDPELEELRIACVKLPKEFPPTDRRHYCSPAGLAKLESLVSRLEAGKRYL